MSANSSLPRLTPPRRPFLARAVLLCGTLALAPLAQATLLVHVAKAVRSSDPVAVQKKKRGEK